MPAKRYIGITLIAGACLVLLIVPRHRRAVARRLATVRRFVSHRIVDEDARATSPAIEAWEDEGGAVVSY